MDFFELEANEYILAIRCGIPEKDTDILTLTKPLYAAVNSCECGDRCIPVYFTKGPKFCLRCFHSEVYHMAHMEGVYEQLEQP
jgi:hypothetical protein